MNKLINVPYLKDTATFVYQLYSIVNSTYYRIANITSGLSLPASDFTPGPIQSFSVVAVDSQII